MSAESEPTPVAPGALRSSADSLAVLFTRALRTAGVTISMSDVLVYVQALGEVGMGERDGVYWAGRATLLNKIEDVPAYDSVFDAFWGFSTEVGLIVEEEAEQITLAFDDEDGDPPPEDGEPEEADGPVLSVRWSGQEILREKDFAACNAAELEELRRLMDGLQLAGEQRSSRRTIRSKRRRGRPDLKRTVGDALRSDGEPVRLRRLQNGERHRRLVLILDVSGSMESYSRALLRFVHAAAVGRTKVEVFVLGTRLTRLTRELKSRDPDAALANAAAAVSDWSGGTRLGEGFRQFNDEWGVRGMARGAIVVILSDGWDRGDPDLLAEQMERLHRVTHRLVWVNPLKASEGYAPLAQGMAAALPHVDEFIEGHSLTSLEQLAAVVDGASFAPAAGYTEPEVAL